MNPMILPENNVEKLIRIIKIGECKLTYIRLCKQKMHGLLTGFFFIYIQCYSHESSI